MRHHCFCGIAVSYLILLAGERNDVLKQLNHLIAVFDPHFGFGRVGSYFNGIACGGITANISSSVLSSPIAIINPIPGVKAIFV